MSPRSVGACTRCTRADAFPAPWTSWQHWYFQKLHAKSIVVWPTLSLYALKSKLKLTEFSMNVLATLKRPDAQAEWKVVWPMMSLAFRSILKVAEISMNILTTLEWPSPHAKWKAVFPKMSITLRLMLTVAEHEHLGYIMMTKSACHMESCLTFFVFDYCSKSLNSS